MEKCDAWKAMSWFNWLIFSLKIVSQKSDFGIKKKYVWYSPEVFEK